MVKVLLLGLLAIAMCGFVSAVSVSHINRFAHKDSSSPASPPPPLPVEDPSVRSERSTNLSHITGTARKIQMFIKNRHLQLLPDGTVNGTSDDHSVYTILQRTTVGIGKLKIQGVATCQYLCMDSCGLLYGSREFEDECVFNEMIEQHHYNTYSSTKYSNDKRTLYLALNRRGQPRKVMLKANQQLGRLSSYTRVLTRSVVNDRGEELHPMRHHSHFCATTTTNVSITHLPSTSDTLKCRKRKKKKKKKRKCTDDNVDNELCQKKQTVVINRRTQHRPNNNSNNNNNTNSTKKCENEDSDECQRVEVLDKKKHKSKLSDNDRLLLQGAKKRKKLNKTNRNKKAPVITSTESVVVADDIHSDEDYIVETTTMWEWEDSTILQEESSISTPRPD